jgi:hypothetical protein
MVYLHPTLTRQFQVPKIENLPTHLELTNKIQQTRKAKDSQKRHILPYYIQGLLKLSISAASITPSHFLIHQNTYFFPVDFMT